MFVSTTYGWSVHLLAIFSSVTNLLLHLGGRKESRDTNRNTNSIAARAVQGQCIQEQCFHADNEFPHHRTTITSHPFHGPSKIHPDSLS